MSARRKLKPASIEQTMAVFSAEADASPQPIKKPKLSPEVLRAIIGGLAFAVILIAQQLSSKDPDGEGIDDYFAAKLMALALDMQSFAATGKLPTGFAG